MKKIVEAFILFFLFSSIGFSLSYHPNQQLFERVAEEACFPFDWIEAWPLFAYDDELADQVSKVRFDPISMNVSMSSLESIEEAVAKWKKGLRDELKVHIELFGQNENAIEAWKKRLNPTRLQPYIEILGANHLAIRASIKRLDLSTLQPYIDFLERSDLAIDACEKKLEIDELKKYVEILGLDSAAVIACNAKLSPYQLSRFKDIFDSSRGAVEVVNAGLCIDDLYNSSSSAYDQANSFCKSYTGIEIGYMSNLVLDFGYELQYHVNK